MSGVSAVAAGDYHSFAVTSDTGLWAWGSNFVGQLGDGSTTDQHRPKLIMDNVAEAAGGNSHTLARKSDGSLWAWGYNWYGQLGDGTSGPGSNHSSPVFVMNGVTAIAAGSVHSLALKTDGSLWAWGSNLAGQLGDGTTEQRTRPVQVLTGVIAMSTAYYHSLALKNDGSLWAWGSNVYGQLGDGTQTDRLSPVQVFTAVAAMSAGGYHSIARKTDGSLWAWGRNSYGQLGDGTTTDRLRPVPVQGFTPTGPTAPSMLAAGAVSSSQINLTWRDNSTNERGFRIERRLGTGAWAQIGQVGANVRTFASTGLTAGTTYSYRVLAYNTAGVSAYSNEASATTQGGMVAKPKAPTSLVARAASNRQVNLTWRDNATNEAGYRIERRIGTAAWTQIAEVAANTISFANLGLTPNTSYTYRVRAFNTGGTSAYATSRAVRTPR
jgi:hypothetical protein